MPKTTRFCSCISACAQSTVVLTVGLGLVVLNELLQLFHLSEQELYVVPIDCVVAHKHIAPRSRGLLRNVASDHRHDGLLSLGGADGSVKAVAQRSLLRLRRTWPSVPCAASLPLIADLVPEMAVSLRSQQRQRCPCGLPKRS